jgi:hypothetical protein
VGTGVAHPCLRNVLNRQIRSCLSTIVVPRTEPPELSAYAAAEGTWGLGYVGLGRSTRPGCGLLTDLLTRALVSLNGKGRNPFA